MLARRACRHLQLQSALNRPTLKFAQTPTRALHSSPIVLKKKAAAQEVADFDEFENEADEGDLFGEPTPTTSLSDPTLASTTSASTTTTSPSTQKPKHRHVLLLNKHASARQAKEFVELLAFVEPRVGRNPAVKAAQVKGSAWQHLVERASSEEEVGRVVGLFGKWREAKGGVRDAFAGALAKRCADLHCPDLALSVFGNYAKYQLPLTLPAGRQLLRTYHTTSDLPKLLAVSNLYSVYGLPPAQEDLVSCALITSACLTSANQGSEKVEGEKVKRSKEERYAAAVSGELLGQLRERVQAAQAVKLAAKSAAASKYASVSASSSSFAGGATDGSVVTKTLKKSTQAKTVLDDTQGMKWVRWALHNVEGVLGKKDSGKDSEVGWVNDARFSL